MKMKELEPRGRWAVASLASPLDPPMTITSEYKNQLKKHRELIPVNRHQAERDNVLFAI